MVLIHTKDKNFWTGPNLRTQHIFFITYAIKPLSAYRLLMLKVFF